MKVTSDVWSGRKVAVIATGPSLLFEDVARLAEAGHILVGVNSAWKIWRNLDALYAGDYRYWKAYAGEIDRLKIKAKRFSRSSRAEKMYGAKYTKSALGDDYNSGELAVELAIRRGADRVVMTGFDASVKHGIHCHGEHTKTPNPNPERCRRWRKQFARILQQYPNANVVNASRYTEITSIPQVRLDDCVS
jgi:hypothetical protein